MIQPLQRNKPQAPITNQTRVKTQEKYLHIDPFIDKYVLRVVETYQAMWQYVQELEPQADAGRIAIGLKKQTTTVHLHWETGSC